MTTLSLAQLQNGHSKAPPAAPEKAVRPGHLVDSHGRVIRDLRLSVTDRCNFRCIYCMDPDFRYMPKQELLTLGEYLALVRVCVSLGVTKVRITGGEPTLYPQLDELIEHLGRMNIPDLSMTTNGSLVTREKALRWKSLGLRRLTLSLDSLRPERVKAITRAKVGPETVIEAIRIAHETGLGPVKVNAVIMRGINDDEVADMAEFAMTHGIDYRLIEFMPLDSEHAWSMEKVFSAREMLERIEARHALIREEDDDPSSTSMNFRFASLPSPPGRGAGGEGALNHDASPPGRIGLIAPVTRPFCGACSRLRITADGKVRPCLFSHEEWDIRAVLRDSLAPGSTRLSSPKSDGGSNGNARGEQIDPRAEPGAKQIPALDARLRRFLIDSMWTKQAGHGIGSRAFHQPERTMSAIGG
jgi:cyclic pyranopterin phosphate synthase